MDRRTFLSLGPDIVVLASSALLARAAGQRADTTTGDAITVSEQGQGIPVSRFGSDEAALRRAIATGAAQVEIDTPITVASDITLRSNQTLQFTTGRLVVPAHAAIIEAVLRNRRGRNIAVVDPVIDAGAVKGGTTAILLADTVDAKISGGRLIHANLRLEGNPDAPSGGTTVTDTVIDLAGVKGTALYLSGVRDVVVSNLTCLNGLEGVGIYNNARRIALRNCVAYGHRQDGFVVIAGQQIAHTGCRSHDNGQSGFTTQRQTGGNDSRFVTWTECEAWNNAYDGFDIRGATAIPWQVDTGFVLTRCNAYDNAECGFYVVKAEGTTIENCTATLNSQQNLFIDSSDRVTVHGFRSLSGAARVATGPNKAGILVYNSHDVRLVSPVSANDRGSTQEFGISFTGNSRNARVSGGDFVRNREGSRLGGDGADLQP